MRRCMPLKRRRDPGLARRRTDAAAGAAEAREGDRRRAALGERRRTQPDGVVQGARHERGGDARARTRRAGTRRSDCRQCRRGAHGVRRRRGHCRCACTRRRRRPSRFSTRFARSAPICSSSRGTSATPANRRARSPRRAATSISRRCASRIASKGRRRWASSSPNSSAGSCRRTSSIPTGGGTGLIGMWKVFAEMREGGWLPKDIAMPHMVVAQADGCAPIVRAFAAGLDRATPWENPDDAREWIARAGPARRSPHSCARCARARATRTP